MCGHKFGCLQILIKQEKTAECIIDQSQHDWSDCYVRLLTLSVPFDRSVISVITTAH